MMLDRAVKIFALIVGLAECFNIGIASASEVHWTVDSVTGPTAIGGGTVLYQREYQALLSDIQASTPGAIWQFGGASHSGLGWTFSYGEGTFYLNELPTPGIGWYMGVKDITVQHAGGPLLNLGNIIFSTLTTATYAGTPVSASHGDATDTGKVVAEVDTTGDLWHFTLNYYGTEPVPELPISATVPLALALGLGIFMLRRTRRFNPVK